MAKKCKNCGLLNLDSATECASCGSTDFELGSSTDFTDPTEAVSVPQEPETKHESKYENKSDKPRKRHWKLIVAVVIAMLLSVSGNVFTVWFAINNWDKITGSQPATATNTDSDAGNKQNNNNNISDPGKPDRTAPVIKFSEQRVKVLTGSTFLAGDNVESVVDDTDGVLNEFAKKPQAEVGYYICVSKPVDTSKPGEYTVTYTAYDAAGNYSEKSYTVVVADEFYDAGYITSLKGITQSEKERIKGYADSAVRAKVASGYKIDQNTIKYEGLMMISLKDAYADTESLSHNKYMLVYSAVDKSTSAGKQVYYVVTYENVTAKDDGTCTVVESESSIKDYYAGSLSDIVRDYVTTKSDKYNYELGDGMEAYDSAKVN